MRDAGSDDRRPWHPQGPDELGMAAGRAAGRSRPGEAAGNGAPAPPVHDARALTGGGTVARITLDGVAYVLRITRQGKLILTK